MLNALATQTALKAIGDDLDPESTLGGTRAFLRVLAENPGVYATILDIPVPSPAIVAAKAGSPYRSKSFFSNADMRKKRLPSTGKNFRSTLAALNADTGGRAAVARAARTAAVKSLPQSGMGRLPVVPTPAPTTTVRRAELVSKAKPQRVPRPLGFQGRIADLKVRPTAAFLTDVRRMPADRFIDIVAQDAQKGSSAKQRTSDLFKSITDRRINRKAASLLDEAASARLTGGAAINFVEKYGGKKVADTLTAVPPGQGGVVTNSTRASAAAVDVSKTAGKKAAAKRAAAQAVPVLGSLVDIGWGVQEGLDGDYDDMVGHFGDAALGLTLLGDVLNISASLAGEAGAVSFAMKKAGYDID